MDGYLRNRKIYENVSGSTTIAVGTADYTLIAAKTNFTVYVQRIIVWITTSAAQSLSFEDTTTGLAIATVPSSPGDGTRWDFDFGPEGRPLTASEGLALDASAAGNVGHVEVLAYRKPNTPLAM